MMAGVLSAAKTAPFGLDCQPVGERLESAARKLSNVRERLEKDSLLAKLGLYETALDKISQGVCFYDGDKCLLICNRRYSEIYKLGPEDVQIGSTLRQVTERRYAAGTGASQSMEDYLSRQYRLHEDPAATKIEILLRDGRTILVCHQPMPDGGWVATHDDVTQSRNESVSIKTLIDTVPDYLWIKDRASRFVVANLALARDSNLNSAASIVGKTDFDMHSPERAGEFFAIEQEIIRTGQPKIGIEERITASDGAEKWLLSTKIPVRTSEGEIFGLVGIAHDVTKSKQADDLRDGQSRILEMIATSAPLREILDALILLIESQISGVRGSIMLLDKSGEHLVAGAAPHMPEDYVKAVNGVRIGPNVGSCGTAAYLRKTVIVADISTDPLWEHFSLLALDYGFRSCWSIPVMSHQGVVLGTFAMYSPKVRVPVADEIRLFELCTRIAGIAIERKAAEERIQFMANHDALTGLPNRTLLKDRLAQAIGHARIHDLQVTVLFIDLDNFKTVNDSLGHNAGDELLKTIAARMAACVHVNDTVVRLGGDEFVVILSGHCKEDQKILPTLERLQGVIAEPIQLDGHDFCITCSIGVASFPQDGIDGDTLLANADAAMYRAKDIGRDNFRFYTPEFNASIHAKFKMQEELRHAMARNQFSLIYQPQLDLRTGKIFAVEALLRWTHPEYGPVSPARFIPLAEETGLIVSIGEWVLLTACRQNKSWQEAGLPQLTMCVNVSARQFKERNWVSRVVSVLQASGLAAQFLELELTESLIMQDVEQAVATMKELQLLGIQLAIDDFGTGYSSLSSLKKFPVARLKIDRSFVLDIPNNEHDKAVVSAVISLGQILNMRVIAEGVETDAQVEFLRSQNCDEMQGYHFSRPVDAAKISQLLKERN